MKRRSLTLQSRPMLCFIRDKGNSVERRPRTLILREQCSKHADLSQLKPQARPSGQSRRMERA